MPNPISARFFCGNDLIAIGAIKALAHKGLLVPEVVAVVGFDDINMAQLYNPSLTTVRQPIREMGGACIDLMMELIQKGDLSPHKKIMFQMELVKRESCGAKVKLPLG